jgi:hypothetical protein
VRGERRIRPTNEELSGLVRELVARDAKFVIRAGGASMIPNILPGTPVNLTPRRSDSVQASDVVLLLTASLDCVLHRVIAVRGEYVQTRGDGNVVADKPVPLESILAVARSIMVEGREVPIPNARLARARRVYRAIRYRIGGGHRRLPVQAAGVREFIGGASGG